MENTEPQKILDALASYHTNIGILMHDQGFHKGVIVQLDAEIFAFRAKTVEIEKELTKKAIDEDTESQKPMDALELYYANIKALMREQAHHSSVSAHIDTKIGEFKVKAVEIERQLIKPPTEQNDPPKPD